MNTRLHELAISDQQIQPIDSMSALSAKYYNRKRTSRLTSKLRSLAIEELVVIPHQFAVEADSSALLVGDGRLGEGREESRAEVQFGQLLTEGPTSSVQSSLVAVKYTLPHLAAKEFSATGMVQGRVGENAAYMPLGFLRRDNTHVGFLTKYESSSRTIDNVLWRECATKEERLGAAAFAGVWMSTLHDAALAHGDAQPKNIIRLSNGQPLYGDLETLQDLDVPEVMPAQLQQKDIGEFVLRQPQALSAEERDAFIDTYTQTGRTSYVSADDIRRIHSKPLKNVVRFSQLSKLS